jgi:hypothetical protein
MLQPDRPKILVGFEAARMSTWTNFDVDTVCRGRRSAPIEATIGIEIAADQCAADTVL